MESGIRSFARGSLMRVLLLALSAVGSVACSGSGPLRVAAGDGVVSTPAKPLPPPTDWRAVPACQPGEAAYDCDRRAILAMAGEFEVSFAFDETVILAPDYERKPAHRSGARELVLVIEDSAERIVLQHLLQVGAAVVKHWRQDWRYQQDTHWEYRGAGRFEPRQRDAAQVPGSWTQYVYDVNDAPRYAGSGRWNHRYGVSTWTSDRSWRPLPRRDYSKRDDYHLINAENRHTITPSGWTHEQDNTKTVRGVDGDRTLTREFGFNEYRRVSGIDFGAAHAYWQASAPFWAAVRQRWDAALADQRLQLAYSESDDERRSELLQMADALIEAGRLPDLGELDERFPRWLQADGEAAEGLADHR